MAFYLTCISDLNKDIFPQNSAHSFRNEILPEIDIENYEVSLAEISYKKSINPPNPHPLNDPPTLYIFDFLYQRTSDPPTYGQWVKIKIDESEYDSPESLCTLLNKYCWFFLPRLRSNPDYLFSYDKDMKRIWFTNPAEQYFLVLIKGYLLKLMGLSLVETKNDVTPLGMSKRAKFYKYGKELRKFHSSCQQKFKSMATTKNYGRYEPLLCNSRYQSFLVYSNVVSGSLIGSQRVNFLRIISLEDHSNGEIVTRTFQKRFYMPVGQTSLREVEVQLRMIDDGVLVPLTGLTRLTLHFRPKRL